MKNLFMILIIILFGIGLGYLIHIDAGYVAIYYAHTTIETSLWAAAIIIILAFILLHLVTRCLAHLFHLKYHIGRWSQSRATNKEHHLTNQAIDRYIKKDWQQAEKNMLKAAEHSQAPLQNYLEAAKSAHHLGAYNRRDQHLNTAYQDAASLRPSILLFQAQLQIDAQQYQLAIASLSQALASNPNDKAALALLYDTYKILNDWSALNLLLPKLRKYKVISKDEASKTALDIAMNELVDTAKNDPLTTIQAVWDNFATSLQRQPTLLLQYVKILIQHHADRQAQTLIEKTLSKQWIPQMLSLYTLIQSNNPAQLLATAEKWLSNHPQDTDLLLTLGKLALNANFYQKAHEYLQQLLLINPSTAAYKLQGELYEAQQQLSAALTCYQKGIAQLQQEG